MFQGLDHLFIATPCYKVGTSQSPTRTILILRSVSSDLQVGPPLGCKFKHFILNFKKIYLRDRVREEMEPYLPPAALLPKYIP